MRDTDDACVVDQVVETTRTKDTIDFSLCHEDGGFVDDVQLDDEEGTLLGG